MCINFLCVYLYAVDQHIPQGVFFPDGTRIIWIPNNVNDVKPKLNNKYASIDDAIAMYKSYTAKANFDMRKVIVKRRKSIGVLTHRYIVYAVGDELLRMCTFFEI